MTSSNGNIFRVTGPLCGEFTGPGEFPTQRPVMRSFDVFFDLCLNKRLSKQPWGWWFETPSWSLWRQCNDLFTHRFVAFDRGHSVRFWEFRSPGAAGWQLHQWNGVTSFIAGIPVSQWWFCYLWQNSMDAVSMVWYDEEYISFRLKKPGLTVSTDTELSI